MYNLHPEETKCAIVLGTDEIASAIGVRLRLAGWAVILSQDKSDPVLRRNASFHDVLYGEAVTLSGIAGRLAETSIDIVAAFSGGDALVVTPLDLMDILVILKFDLLVDARTGEAEKPDLRWLARNSVGIGTGYATGVNCDTAIPRTDAPHGPARGGQPIAGSYVISHACGRWHTAREIGARVSVGAAIGNLNGLSINAPCCGTIAGLVRDGTIVRRHAKLVEIVPEYPAGTPDGLDARGHAISRAMMAAIDAGFV
jgi:xanthine dehydrogenase accessory factor